MINTKRTKIKQQQQYKQLETKHDMVKQLEELDFTQLVLTTDTKQIFSQ
jgi:hypothetical protein